MNLTFRMLINIHFQKYHRFWKAIYTVSVGVWNLNRKTSAVEI